MARVLVVAGLVMGMTLAGGPLQARPRPTPLAELEGPPRRRGQVRVEPWFLPLDPLRLSSLGDPRLVTRPDGFADGLRMSTAVEGEHLFRAGGMAVIYQVGPDPRPPASIDPRDEYRPAVDPVGLGRVVEVHPLGKGRERVVIRVKCRHLKLERDEDGRVRAVWAPGQDPARGARYFAYAGNFTGLPHQDYERLAAGKIWVGMDAALIRMALGAPASEESYESPFGRRERWEYPRSPRYSTWIFVDRGQLREWWDDWTPRPELAAAIPRRSTGW